MAKNRTQQSHGEIYERFGQNVAAARQAVGLSQGEAALALGMPQSTYSGYESGTRKVPLSAILQIAELFKTTPDVLINGDPCKDGIVLSDLEEKLVRKFRTLSTDERNMILRSMGIEEKGDEAIEDAG